MSREDAYELLLVVLVALACPLCLPLVIGGEDGAQGTDDRA
ncbi:MAG: hypothetical protein Q3963_05105 [Coriobacteriaceae bacterium]|nr:hypothetical protein [Coriobacteriaceae bacterium]